MSDLPYKLNQLSQSLSNVGKQAWSDVALAACHEIIRLKAALDAKQESRPATKAMIELFNNSRDFTDSDGEWEFPIKWELIDAFLEEQGG